MLKDTSQPHSPVGADLQENVLLIQNIRPCNDASTGSAFGIKPIETLYNNVLFRSRLEARWAVFFTSLGIKWDYEYEGFDLNGTWYLPDFYLHDYNGGCFVEVKHSVFSPAENKKVIDLCNLTKKPVFKAAGSPELIFYEVLFNEDYHGQFNEILTCYSHFYLHYKSACQIRFWVECEPFPYDLRQEASNDLIKAVRTAKSYRF